MSVHLAAKKGAKITLIASDKISAWSRAPFKIFQLQQGSPNIPAAKNLLVNQAANSIYTSSAFSSGATLIVQAGESPLFYATGTGPVIPEALGLESNQAAPGTLNATGTLTGTLILGGIVTSSTAAAVTATLDTGTAMDALVDSAASNDSFFWSAINTGGANAFTVTASSGHTIVGAGAVAASSSGRFLSRRSAAATWVTYRLS